MPKVYFQIRHALLASQELSAYLHLAPVALSAHQGIINHAQDQVIVACAKQILSSPETCQLNASHVLQGQLQMENLGALTALNVFAAQAVTT